MHLPGQLFCLSLSDFRFAGFERSFCFLLDVVQLFGLCRFLFGQPATGSAGIVGLHCVTKDKFSSTDGGEHPILCELLHPAVRDAQHGGQLGGGHSHVSNSFFCRHSETTSFFVKLFGKSQRSHYTNRNEMTDFSLTN